MSSDPVRNLVDGATAAAVSQYGMALDRWLRGVLLAYLTPAELRALHEGDGVALLTRLGFSLEQEHLRDDPAVIYGAEFRLKRHAEVLARQRIAVVRHP